MKRSGLRWHDAPLAYGPYKALYNRRARWGERGVFTRMMEGLAAVGAEPKTGMIDAPYPLPPLPGLLLLRRRPRRHRHLLAVINEPGT